MSVESIHSPEADLDRTDRLPVLDGTLFDHDVPDDAEPMDHTTVLPSSFAPAVASLPAEFARSGVDLPSLAESVRSVEERIARQNAEYEALTHAYERARDSELAAAARANALAADLAAARTALDSEQARARETDRALAERIASVEAARSRVEEAQREAERFQTEARTLRDSLAARDATIVQVLHSLGERDAQLAALQAEHSKIIPVLEATSKSSTQLETELQHARAQATAVALELKASQDNAAALAAQFRRGEAEVHATRSELGSLKVHAIAYLERLRSREWRHGFDLNLFRELDARVGAAHVGQGALEAERDRLQAHAAALEEKLAGQSEALDNLRAAAAANAATLAQQATDLTRAEQMREQLTMRLATADAEVTRLKEELQSREGALIEARAAASGDAKRVTELLAESEQRGSERDRYIDQVLAEHTVKLEQTQAEHAARLADLRLDTESREAEMAVLLAHLKEARRPIEVIEAEVMRLTGELAAKTALHDEVADENRRLNASLERTRGALEEREFLIRRLERSESNNANVLGRLQTSIERLGSVAAPGVAPAGGAPVPDWVAEMIRVDGERPITYLLARRTRIGRAPGCELQIDSTSVSRHHALILVGPRDSIIEDLNSTNGVVVNGRKVTRQLLHDGDAVTIGEIHFRYSARPAVNPP